jgi:hypothetical protein
VLDDDPIAAVMVAPAEMPAVVPVVTMMPTVVPAVMMMAVPDNDLLSIG